MRRKILFLIIVIFIMFSHISYAENENSAVITHDGNKITISGKLEKASGPQMVILVIGEYDNVLHTQRIMSEADGSFLFDVVMPQNIEYGEYPYVIAAPALQGTIDYSEPADKEISVDVIVNGDEVIFKGTLVGAASEHEMTLLVGSIDNMLYLNQVTSKSDGSFEFKAVMPEGMKAGEYPYTIGTSADIQAFNGTFQYTNDTTIKEMQVDVTVNGDEVIFKGTLVGAASEHEMTLLVGSIDNILYINQVTSKPDGSFEFKAVMPKGLQSGEYPYTIGTSADIPAFHGTLNYIAASPVEAYVNTESFNVSVNKYIPYFIQTQSIRTLKDKTIIVEYPTELLTLSDACILTSIKETTPTNLPWLGIDIKSVANGRIEFEVTNDFLEKYPIRLIISGIRFKGCSDGTAEITCKIIDKE